MAKRFHDRLPNWVALPSFDWIGKFLSTSLRQAFVGGFPIERPLEGATDKQQLGYPLVS